MRDRQLIYLFLAVRNYGVGGKALHMYHNGKMESFQLVRLVPKTNAPTTRPVNLSFCPANRGRKDK